MASLEQGNGVWPEEEAAVAALRNLFPSDKESYGMPLDDACLVRYLRARENNVEKASTMLTATLEWRQEFGLPEVLKEAKDVVAKENGTGKIYLSGLDRQGRPVMIMRPRLENTFDHDGNIKHLVYQMERAKAIMQKTSGGFGKMCLIIDYAGFTLRHSVPMKTSMQTIRILQSHYPEMLGVAFFISPPMVFRGFWKVISPFIDSATKEKFVFVAGNVKGKAAQAELAKNFAVEELEEAFGGKYAAKFDSTVYLAGSMEQDFREALVASSAAAVPASTK